MAKVYVVESGWMEDDPDTREVISDSQIIEGVFDTEEKAKEWMVSQATIITKQTSERGYFTRQLRRGHFVEGKMVWHSLLDFDCGGGWFRYRELDLQ